MMSDSPRICGVVVTYNPPPDLADNLLAISRQVDAVIVIDNNSSSPDPGPMLSAAPIRNVYHIRNAENLGLATALNQGVRHAIEHQYHWVILFDQDSTPPAGFVDSLLSAYEACPYRSQVGLLGPVYFDRESGAFLFGKRSPGYAPVTTTWTSGSLIPIEVFRRCGLFEDGYFIDSVDHEFCLRLRTHGYVILQVPEAQLSHSLGQLRPHRLFGRETFISAHSALRWYYMGRNRVLTMRRYGLHEPRWAVFELRNFFREWGMMTLFDENRLAKQRSLLRGLIDGIRGRLGPHRESNRGAP